MATIVDSKFTHPRVRGRSKALEFGSKTIKLLRQPDEFVTYVRHYDKEALSGNLKQLTAKELHAHNANLTERMNPNAQLWDERNRYAALAHISTAVKCVITRIAVDTHFGNFGAMLRNGKIVFGLVDGTKAGGKGDLEHDQNRTATTTITATWVNDKVKNKLGRKLAELGARTYRKQLKRYLARYQKDGTLPPGFLEESEVNGIVAADLREAKKRAADPERIIEKFTGTKNGLALKPALAIDPKGEYAAGATKVSGAQLLSNLRAGVAELRTRLKATFPDATIEIPGEDAAGIPDSAFGTQTSVGGSNSGEPHYYFRATLKEPSQAPREVIMEVKALLPSPASHPENGDLSLANGQETLDAIRILTGATDPFLGWMKVGGSDHIVMPYDPAEIDLNPSPNSYKDLACQMKACATVNAQMAMRAIAAEADPRKASEMAMRELGSTADKHIVAQAIRWTSSKGWGKKGADGIQRSADYAEMYAHQSYADEVALRRRLKNQSKPA